MHAQLNVGGVSDQQLICYREGRATVPYFPNIMNIETTNVCNLSCRICPGRDEAHQGFLDFDFFHERILPELSNCPVPRFWLHFNGEPLLHPRINEFISCLTGRGYFARLSTNGLPLVPKVIDGLITSRLDQVVVSIDSTSSETYRSIRGSTKFGRLIENIHALIEAKERAGSTLPSVQVQMVRWSCNDDEVLDFVNFWGREGVDSIYLKPLSSRRGTLTLALAPEESPYLNAFGLDRSPCFYLWDSVVIRWDGRVVPCCADLTGQIALGDLKAQTLWEIWNDSPLQNLRREQYARRFSGACAGCQEWANETGFPGKQPMTLSVGQDEEIMAARGNHVFLSPNLGGRR